jgi:hypothetical protein
MPYDTAGIDDVDPWRKYFRQPSEVKQFMLLKWTRMRINGSLLLRLL